MELPIGIIGGGIVGATAAYYLAKAGKSVVLFDEGIGQATKVAAGIINPWLAQRRNEAWRWLVFEGAEFYHTFMNDLKKDGINTEDIYQIDGALTIRHSEKGYIRDIKLAEKRKKVAPSMGDVFAVTGKEYFPYLLSNQKATLTTGGGRVYGDKLIEVLYTLIEKHGGTIIRQKAYFHRSLNEQITIHTSSTYYEVKSLLLAAGAWLPELLTPHHLSVDIYPQKGQILIYQHKDWKNKHWPVVMLPGKGDIIPFNNGMLAIGATTERQTDYNLSINPTSIDELLENVSKYAPQLTKHRPSEIRVGIRAQSSTHHPIVGKVPTFDNVWAISGLGTSGLTSGPYLAFQWVQKILTGAWNISPTYFPINDFIK